MFKLLFFFKILPSRTSICIYSIRVMDTHTTLEQSYTPVYARFKQLGTILRQTRLAILTIYYYYCDRNIILLFTLYRILSKSQCGRICFNMIRDPFSMPSSSMKMGTWGMADVISVDRSINNEQFSRLYIVRRITYRTIQ